MNLRDLITDLRSALTPEAYSRLAGELDKLADEIVTLEKDKFYKEHPEQCQ